MKFLILGLTLVFSASVFAGTKDCKDTSQFTDVKMDEMRTLVKKPGVVMIDVNSKASFAKDNIGDPTGKSKTEARVFRFESAKTLAANLPASKDTEIVAYCGGVGCNAWTKAAIAACELGYKNIRHFPEGISGWTPKGKTKATKG